MGSIKIVVVDELIYRFFQILRGVIFIEFNHVFHRSVVSFYFPLCLRVHGFSVNGLVASACEKVFQFSGNITAPVVRKELGGILLTQATYPQGHIHRRHHILCCHIRPQIPGQDESVFIIEYGGQIVPSPAYDFEVREIGLP